MTAFLLKGSPVTEAIDKNTLHNVELLSEHGIIPCLAILRFGERPEDLAYERTILHKAEKVGILIRKIILNPSISQSEYESILEYLSSDSSIHGILPFRPIPAQLNAFSAFNHILIEKDVDGCSQQSLGMLFTGSGFYFAPCTAKAVMDILNYYHIVVSGRHAVVLGRSLVVGKPLAQLLLNENATVTVCHSKSDNLPFITRTADIVISSIGKPAFLTKDFFTSNQSVIDVGINWLESECRICGDVLFSEVVSICKEITPVPGGIGSVTTARLLNNTSVSALKTISLSQEI